jgi:hypothetical protein
MPKIAYVLKRFGLATLGIIAQANAVIVEYQKQGYSLTLRQLYYQFVARDLFPDSWIDEAYNRKNGLSPDTKNTVKNYKNLGSIINDARLAGEIDWNAIEDRTRNLCTNSHWDSPADIVEACAKQYTIDLWANQDNHVECWIEKESLITIVEKACRPLDVSHFACKGYVSQSEMWEAAQRLRRKENRGKHTTILHLGDHDPSGIDMTRDIQERLRLFQSDVTVKRIALTMDQINEYSPPPNPAKTTDARFASYEREYGDESWELDALEPKVIVELIQTEVKRLIWDVAWDEAVERQEREQAQLTSVSDRWEEIV